MPAEQTRLRETITASAEARGRCVRQTSEPAYYGDVWLRVEPLARGKGFEFVNALTEEIIPNEYIPSIEEGIHEAMEQGILQGYPMTDLRVTLFGGSFHPVDSGALAYKRASVIGFKEAARKANPIILPLEP